MSQPKGPTDIHVTRSKDMGCYVVLDIRPDGMPELLATRSSRDEAEAAARTLAEWLGLTFWAAPVVRLQPRTSKPREVLW